jgi:tetratricopeptide (TPR) repeat protein
LKILVESEGKLAPRDGQIEARGNTLDWKQYSSSLLEIMLHSTNEHREACLRSLDGFSVKLFNTDQFEEAELLMRKVLEFNPQESHAWSNLGAILTRLKRWKEAESALQCAVMRDPNSAYAHFHKGVYFAVQERYPEAEKEFRDAVACDPSDALAHLRLGLILKLLERYKEAEIECRRAIELDPNEFVYHLELGAILWKMKRFSEAEEILARAIQMKPNDANAWNSLAQTYTELERYAEAESALRRALECDPEFGDAYANLGIIFAHQNKLFEAEAACRHAIQINPLDATYHSNLAGVLKQLGKLAEAEGELQQAIKLGPLNEGFYYHLCEVLYELERWSEAIDIAKRGVKINPNSIQSQFSFGVILAKMGCNVEAEATLQFLYEHFTNDPRFHLGLLELLEALGREEESLIEGDLAILHLGSKVQRIPPLGLGEYLWLATYCRKHNYSADLEELVKRAREIIAEDDWMNLARLECICGNFDLSFDYLLRASEQEDFDPVQVSKDPALEWIRNHPRFSEIVVIPTGTELDDDQVKNHDE